MFKDDDGEDPSFNCDTISESGYFRSQSSSSSLSPSPLPIKSKRVNF